MIIQIASKLYLEKGFAETSNEEICKILSISPGNLTFHYPQREHVITEFVKELCDFQWRMIDVLEHEDKSPLLALCIEFATNAAIAEESDAMRDIFISAYTHVNWQAVETTRQKMIEKSQKSKTKKEVLT